MVFTSAAFIIPTISFTAFNRFCQKEITLGFHLTAGFTELTYFSWQCYETPLLWHPLWHLWRNMSVLLLLSVALIELFETVLAEKAFKINCNTCQWGVDCENVDCIKIFINAKYFIQKFRFLEIYWMFVKKKNFKLGLQTLAMD